MTQFGVSGHVILVPIVHFVVMSRPTVMFLIVVLAFLLEVNVRKAGVIGVIAVVMMDTFFVAGASGVPFFCSFRSGFLVAIGGPEVTRVLY